MHQDKNREILDWDSYVELRQLLRFSQADIARATLIGRMSQSEARDLAWSASKAPTLKEEFRHLIWTNLVDEWR